MIRIVRKLGTSAVRKRLGHWRRELRELRNFLRLQLWTGFAPPGQPGLDEQTRVRFIDLLQASTGYLEFGAGGSTLVADRLGVRTLTIEADRFYARTVRRALKQPSLVHVRHVNIGLTREWSRPIFHRPTILRRRRWRRYIREPFKLLARLGWFPDFVLVDGRFRRACILATAREAVRRRCCVTIMVDDYFRAGREHYHQVERWLGSPQRAGSAALFEIDAAALPVSIDDADIAEAARDYR